MKELDDLEFLKAVRHRIRVPQLWCKGHYEVGGRRCLIGAGAEVLGMDPVDIQFIAEVRLRDLLGCIPHALNDSSTHAQVLAKLDEAITRLEGS